MTNNIDQIIKDIKSKSNREKAEVFQRFFKTGKGEYGYGDEFIGVMVPEMREISKKYYKEISLDEVDELIKNKIHEIREVAIFILVLKYQHTKDKQEKEKIVKLYLKNTKYINNWDLVDLSVYKILGDYIFNNREKINILYKLSDSKDLWERRMSIVGTMTFIRNKEYKDAFNIIEKMLDDKNDLIHKASGWMLREIGKKSGEEIEEQFLKKHYKTMPRTMLRYAIEKFSEEKRGFYLNNK